MLVLHTSTRFNPGPGTYEPRDVINPNGSYMMSNMTNTLTPSFSHSNLQKGRNGLSIVSRQFMPGPGTYTPQLEITSPTVLTSVYKSTLVKTFYHNDRFPAKVGQFSKSNFII